LSSALNRSTITRFFDAEVELKELQDAAAEQERIDKAAAAAVDSLVDEIGDVTLDSKQAIETARAAYDNLTPTQKTYVTKLNNSDCRRSRV